MQARVWFQQFAQISNPVVRLPFGELGGVAVTVAHGADFDSRAAAGLHISRRVSDEETVCGRGAQALQRGEYHVGRGLVGDSIAPLDMIEVPRQSEMLEDQVRAGGAFGGRSRLPT